MRRTVLALSIVGAVAAVCAPSASAASPCQSSEWSFTSPAKSVYQAVCRAAPTRVRIPPPPLRKPKTAEYQRGSLAPQGAQELTRGDW